MRADQAPEMCRVVEAAHGSLGEERPDQVLAEHGLELEVVATLVRPLGQLRCTPKIRVDGVALKVGHRSDRRPDEFLHAAFVALGEDLCAAANVVVRNGFEGLWSGSFPCHVLNVP